MYPPCKTPVSMSKKLVSPSGEWTIALNFLNFGSDIIEMVGIINFLAGDSIKNYASVILSDSKVIFLGEGNDATFHLILYCVLFIDCIALTEKSSNFFVTKLQGVFSQGLQLFCFNFFSMLHQVLPLYTVLVWELVGH